MSTALFVPLCGNTRIQPLPDALSRAAAWYPQNFPGVPAGAPLPLLG